MNPDFLDMLSTFSNEKVEFLLVGAYALSAHGFPRATGDMDLWIRNSPDNAARVWKALISFHAPLERIQEKDFCKEDLDFQIGVIPNRIDILTHIDGVTFDEAWKEHVSIDLCGLKIPVIGKVCLIRNKKATGRPQDKIDAMRLEGEVP